MLKKIVNEAFFTLRITTTGPLLVKSGHASVSGPDMTPVLTWRNGKQEVQDDERFADGIHDRSPTRAIAPPNAKDRTPEGA